LDLNADYAAMRVKVSREFCLRCGSCEAVCPEVFIVKADGVHLRRARVPAACRGACRVAADLCPVDAISLAP